VTRGTVDGAQLLVNIVAMLVVLVALVSLANQVLALLPEVARCSGHAAALVRHRLGASCLDHGHSLGGGDDGGRVDGYEDRAQRVARLRRSREAPRGALSPRSRLMMTYALCGFANFGSLGIMIGGLATMAPERRDEIVSLGGKNHRLRNACGPVLPVRSWACCIERRPGSLTAESPSPSPSRWDTARAIRPCLRRAGVIDRQVLPDDSS